MPWTAAPTHRGQGRGSVCDMEHGRSNPGGARMPHLSAGRRATSCPVGAAATPEESDPSSPGACHSAASLHGSAGAGVGVRSRKSPTSTTALMISPPPTKPAVLTCSPPSETPSAIATTGFT